MSKIEKSAHIYEVERLLHEYFNTKHLQLDRSWWFSLINNIFVSKLEPGFKNKRFNIFLKQQMKFSMRAYMAMKVSFYYIFNLLNI